MTAIDASVSELSSSLVRRPLSLLPSSPSAEFTLFTSSASATVASELGPATESVLSCYETGPSELIDGSRSSSTSSTTTNGNNSSNWLADLSVEVCKVETVEEGSNSDGGGGGGGGGGGSGDGTSGPPEWDESVFFEAAAAAAASCCATTGQSNHHHHSHDSGHLDVLLGNPNLHNSSGSDLLELDGQNCCTVDFPLSPKQLLGGSASSSRSSSSSSSSHISGSHSSSNSNHSSCTEDGQLATTGLSSPPSTPSPASSSSGGRQLQTLPQPPQPCSMCSKVFTSTSALAKHKLTHSDERRFSCQLCGKAFKRQDHLNGHLITHREKKPFECRADGCGKSYCDARSLRRHQDNHHASSGSHVQPSSPSTGLVISLPSRSSSASSNAGLMMNELSGGSPELIIPPPSNGSTYPAPSSNSSTNSNHHFVNQTANINDQQAFTGCWDSSVQLESCIQYESSTVNGFVAGLTSCSTDNAESHSWAAVPAASVSPKDGKKPTTNGIKSVPTSNNKATNNNNSASNHSGTSKNVAMSTSTSAGGPVKSGSKKSKAAKVANGKSGGGNKSNASNKKTASESGVGANNDGLTTQQLELIQEIMRQTQEQHRLMQEEQQQQQQHMQQQHKPTATHSSSGPASSSNSSSSAPSKIKKSNTKVKWTTPPSSSVSSGDPTQSTNADGTAANGTATGRPVECNVCQRRFKNTPALNGHMRLHGGFLKKDAIECNGSNSSVSASGSNAGGGAGGATGGGNGNGGNVGSGGSGKKPGENKKDPNNPPLLTASVSVRALIEEKIIQRRNNLAANNHSSAVTGTSSSSPQTTATTVTTSSSSVTPSSSNSSASVVILQPDQPHALSISVHPANPAEVSVMMMDVLDDERRDPTQVQSQPSLIPKLEPEGYFEGSLLALSPVSLHRALEGDMDVTQDETGGNEVVGGSGLHHLHHQGESFFSTSSSSSSALSDVPLLDDSVFHQVSAAAASALLSDISGLDLQSYMESGHGAGHPQQMGHSGGQYTDLSQYLASSNVDHGTGVVYQHESGGFQPQQQQQHSDHFVYQHHDSTSAGLGAGFSFDPSPSTPLSSLCSPQHYVQQYHHAHQTDYHNNNNTSIDTSSTGYQSMLMPTVPSPYTPSPSPVSPAVAMASTLPHMQRFQSQSQQQRQDSTAGFYSTSSFSSHNQSNFMIDCANSVLYNMESGGGGWDHAADLTSVATDALPQLMDQEHPSEPHQHQHQQQQPSINGSSDLLVKAVKVKKTRMSRAKRDVNFDDPDATKRRRNAIATNATAKKSSNKRDELDDFLGSESGDQHVSAMNWANRHSTLLLNPKRNGIGLYWNLVREKQVSPPPAQPQLGASTSRSKSRVRVGKDHQCVALPRCKKKESNKDRESAVLCWSGSTADQWKPAEVDRLLAWSRSAALPGPKRGEEEVLAVLTHFNGDIQATKIHLLTHPTGFGAQPNEWTPDEMAIFHAALLQHGKDFSQVAQHLPAKTASQCIQFYYLWKKVCRPGEYASIKRSRTVTAASQSSPGPADETSLCDWRDVGCEGDLISLAAQTSVVPQDCSASSPSSQLLLLSSCEFADCSAMSTNGVTQRRYQSIPPNTASPTVTDKLYPCSVCHKVFDKVKSRSAHMKTHKSATIATNQDGLPLLGNKNRKNHHVHHKSPLETVTPTSPVSSTSHSSTSCSLPSPFLPSQSLF